MAKVIEFYKNNKGNIFKWSIILFFTMFLCIIAFYEYKTYIVPIGMNNKTQLLIENSSEEEELIKDAKDNMQLVQSFFDAGIGVSEVWLKCKVDNEDKEKDITVTLCDVDKIIQKWTLDKGEKKDDFIVFVLDESIMGKEGKDYSIKISYGDNVNGSDIAFYKTPDNGYLNGSATQGETIIGDLSFKVKQNNVDNTFLKNIFWMIFVVFLIIWFFGCYGFFIKRNLKIEIFFLVFMIGFGCMYSILLPPMCVPDEAAHYATAYKISNQMLGVKNDTNEMVRCRKSDAIMMYDNTVEIDTYRYVFNSIFSKNEKIENEGIYLGAKVIEGVPMIGHLPQAIGISIARLFNFSFSGLLYLGRVFALIFYVVLVYCAIKIIPIGKQIIFAISAFPVSLQQVGSFSYDPIIIALSFFLIAYIVYLIYEKESVQWKQTFITCIFVLILAPCKMIYSLIPFIVLLIPNRKFSTIKKAVSFKVLIPAASLLWAVIYNMQFISKSSSGSNYIGWAGENGYTVSILLHDIPHMIYIYVATLFESISFFVCSAIGSSLGYFNIHIPQHYLIIFAIFLFMAMQETHKYTISYEQRLWFFLVQAGVCFLASTTMLLGWTPLSYNTIQGIQGRYFIPVLPMAFLALVTNKDTKRDYKEIVCLGSSAANFLVLFRIINNIIGF